jgi:lipase
VTPAPARLPPLRDWSCGGPRPVLALHCTLAHAGAWSGLAAHLSGLHLTATDQPGHGRAAAFDGQDDLHTLTTRQTIAVAETLGDGGPVDLIGHSFGATVMLRVALERPDLARSLTLIEPVLFAAARAAESPAFRPHQARHAATRSLWLAGRAEAAAAAFHAEWGPGVDLAALPEQTRRYVTDRMPLVLAQDPALSADSAGLLRPWGLEALGVPVLLIEGAESPAVIAAITAELARRLPRVDRLVVPGAGHMVPITHPAVVARAVQAHLDAC